MQFSTRTIGDVSVLTLSGRVDRGGATEMELVLMAELKEGHTQIALDLSDVPYINSTGLRVLANVLIQARDGGGNLVLVNLHPRVKRVFEIIGFLQFFEVYSDIDAAVTAFDADDASAKVA